MLQQVMLLMLHLALLRVAIDLPMEIFSLDVRVMERGGQRGAQEMAAWRGMATRRGTAGDRPPQVDAGHAHFKRGGVLVSVVSDRSYFRCLFDEIGQLLLLPVGWPRGVFGRVLALDAWTLVASIENSFLMYHLKQWFE
jgi:hypothetical protein